MHFVFLDDGWFLKVFQQSQIIIILKLNPLGLPGNCSPSHSCLAQGHRLYSRNMNRDPLVILPACHNSASLPGTSLELTSAQIYDAIDSWGMPPLMHFLSAEKLAPLVAPINQFPGENLLIRKYEHN